MNLVFLLLLWYEITLKKTDSMLTKYCKATTIKQFETKIMKKNNDRCKTILLHKIIGRLKLSRGKVPSPPPPLKTVWNEPCWELVFDLTMWVGVSFYRRDSNGYRRLVRQLPCVLDIQGPVGQSAANQGQKQEEEHKIRAEIEISRSIGVVAGER